MKIILAPNAFKDSLTALEAAQAMQTGILRVLPDAETVLVPVADGGDGLLEVMRGALAGHSTTVTVSNPLGDLVEAPFSFFPDTRIAAVEMALASGLALLAPEKRDVMKTTTLGTGELIRAALDQGATRIYVGIGGSATNDGGVGMATALGIDFLDAQGKKVPPTGENLINIERINPQNIDPRIRKVQIDVVCDVDNPLLGVRGASRVYAPQKGASPEQVELLEVGLSHLADVIERDLGIDVRLLSGGGAAGGLGAGLVAFLGAKLNAGIDLVLELVELNKKMQGASLVLTAEGQMDEQTVNAKAPAGVAQMAQANGIPCLAFCGGVKGDPGVLRKIGIQAVFSICPAPVPLAVAMEHAAEFLADSTEQVFRVALLSLKKE
ncbi:MAG: glycerate kinase [Kiritimatiellae bacterium]|nr:glycerate kinase [Kiritimatiellia bacterium]